MDKSVILKKLKHKFISKQKKFKELYKDAYITCNFLSDIADTTTLKPIKGKLREYQLQLIEFAQEWLTKFEDLNISYFLISGNLLGAYRNNQFIPWDDDFDIGMMRDDFEKLQKYLKDKYKEISVKEISYSINNRSQVIENYVKNNHNKTAFAIFPTHLQILQGESMDNLKTIDIHPFDYYPDSYTDEDFKNKIINIKKKKQDINNFYNLNKYLKDERLKCTVQNSDKIYYGFDNYDFTFLPYKEAYKVSDIFPLKQVNYENIKCFIPNNPEKFLLINYGTGYMDMPKDIKLKSHIEYRIRTAPKTKYSRDKQILLKKIKRRFFTKEEDIYKQLYKKIKLNRDLLLDIIDIKTIKPCKNSLLRKYQLNCVDFCKSMTDLFDANNLEYFITSGTLIGAVRHQGFVPWDDDFDVGMMRNDYEKLKTILKNNFKEIDISKITFSLNNQLDIINQALKESNNQIIYFIGPKYIQIYKGTSLSNSVVIDIFPHDYYKEDYSLDIHKSHMSKIKNQINKLDRYTKIINFLNNEIKTSSYVTDKSEYIYYGFDSLGSYIVNPTGPMSYNMIFPRQKIKFENYEFYAPNDPDGYIKVQYPNYMEFPNNFNIAPFLKIKAKYKL